MKNSVKKIAKYRRIQTKIKKISKIQDIQKNRRSGRPLKIDYNKGKIIIKITNPFDRLFMCE